MRVYLLSIPVLVVAFGASPALGAVGLQNQANKPTSPTGQKGGQPTIVKAKSKNLEKIGPAIGKKKGKGALKTVPITPGMKKPPHFPAPPSAKKGGPKAGTTSTPPAPPPPPSGPGGPTKGGKTTDLGYGVQEAYELGIDYKKKPKGFKFSLNLENLDLAELVKHIAKITGKKFVLGNKVKQNIKATIIAPTPVTAQEAYLAFLNVLEINDLTIVPDGSFLKIVDSAAGHASLAVPVYTGGGVPKGDNVITKIIHLDYVGATEMAQLLAKFASKGADITPFGTNTLIISDFGSNLKKLQKLIKELDKAGTGDQIWVEKVNYASAADIAEKLSEVLEAAGVASDGGGGKGGKKGGPQPTVAAASDKGANAHLSSIIPEERTNSLIIVASDAAYLQVIQLLHELDVQVPGEGEIHVHSLQHADAEELAGVLNNVVQGSGKGPKGKEGAGMRAGDLFEGEVKLTHDKATNSLVITASMRDYASLRKVIEELDVARRQVFVEAVIMEVQLSKIKSLGVSFNGGSTFDTADEQSLMFGGTTFGSLSSVFLDPTSLTGLALGLRGPEISGAEGILGTGISIPAFGVMVNALQTNNDVNILSTPNILATDNETAEITVGGNVPVQQGYSGMGLGGLASMAGAAGSQASSALGALGSMGGMGMNPMFSIGRQNVGLTLKITPHINDSDQIKMEIELEISEVTGETDLGPLIDQRMAKTVSVVKDQQTVVLGGLVKDNITESVDKVPVLGDIPILGYLFKKKKTRITKTNLLIFLTPYIIRDATDFRIIFNRKMEERREFIEQFTAFNSAEYEPTVDYTRTNGLVEEIHKTIMDLEEEQELLKQIMLEPPSAHEPKTSLGDPEPVEP